MSFYTKFVLPNTVEFLRNIHKIIFLNHKTGTDTETTLSPIVTRAKNLTKKTGVTITTFERTDDG